MTNKEKFIKLLKENCSKRFDVDKFIKYLETETDFFTAPASTKYHLCRREGLLEHSLDVYNNLQALCSVYYPEARQDSITICALLHDLCKVNFYKIEIKNVNVNGVWTKKPIYVVDDLFPVGHGEKSVILLQRQGINLTDEEIYSIRWHMGGFDCAVKGGELAFGTAVSKSKLVTLLNVADTISSNVEESDL